MKRRDVPSVLIFHPQQVRSRGRLVVPPMDIPLDQVSVAVGQGWRVLGSDADVYPAEWTGQRPVHGYGVVRDEDDGN